MRWLLDENIPVGLGGYLRERGHDVVYVAEASPGIADSAVLGWPARITVRSSPSTAIMAT